MKNSTPAAPRAMIVVLIAPAMLYGCWIGMLVAHECGHVLHAWLSGGRVEHPSIPLVGFFPNARVAEPS